MVQYEIHRGDCLELMSAIPDGSVDMICCDLPYGVLNKSNPHTRWDTPLDLGALWTHYRRVCKPNAVIVLFGQGMFSATLMMSNPKMWRYNLVWEKDRVTGFLNAARMPLRCHEDILVFYEKQPLYNPQMEKLNGREPNHPQGYGKGKQTNRCYGNHHSIGQYTPKHHDKKFPRSVLKFAKEHDKRQVHPTQKPVELLRYLIRTYTDEGAVVLDNCMGSGSTGVAAIMEKRRFIGIELTEDYFNVAKKRIEDACARPSLF